ncbi:class I SAM-dependent methyltransferase [Cellulomonas sp. RIT-PI-Y]|uniref:class I SAM-dependent methyltransferase n=1 Tax=Cellulomonas sp. RIT-PI-Y TaxID=3035297 RepID=UPI0021DAEC2B|nr:class I SAM-dependent methyltransferase [Cellulomonas sp. RIT-PI-Y]
MSHYKTTVHTEVRNSSHTIIVGMVGEGKDVLDVGCASGYQGAALIERGCRVSGVEIDEADAAKAREALGDVRVADLDRTELDSLFEPGSFDRVVFGDVLEHLRDPARAVREAMRLLRPDGALVISVPNVAHGSVRLALLQGEWEYVDTGLLDRTHVSFFTHASLLRMLHEEGLAITDLQATVFDPLDTEVPVDRERLPAGVVDWVRAQPFAEVYQFVATAAPVAAVTGPEPVEVVPAVGLPAPADEFVAEADRVRTALSALDDPESAAAQLLDLRHRLVVARDHAIGQEAELAHAREDIARRAGTHEYVNEELRKSIEDAQRAHAGWADANEQIRRLQEQVDRAAPGLAQRAARRVLGR